MPSDTKPADFDLAAALAVIARAMPDEPLAGARLLAQGFDNVAVATVARVFRFPRDETAGERLRQEAALLALVHPRVDLTVPLLELHEDPLFSAHSMIPGQALDGDAYLSLGQHQRDELAEVLAVFYAQLHAIPLADAKAAGAGAAEPFPDPDDLLSQVLPLLNPDQQAWARSVTESMADLSPDPVTVFSWFDGHGWNMAFDRQAGRLNGAFDFADAGIGGLHHDLIHTNLIHPDLTRRLAARYTRLTGRDLDPRRMSVLTGMHRLFDLAQSHDDPDFGQLTRKLLDDWLSAPESRL